MGKINWLLSFFHHLVLFVPCLFLVLLSSVHGEEAETAYVHAKKRYQDLVSSSRQQLYRHNWEKVLRSFLLINTAYPQHDKAAVAAFMAAKTCHGLYRASGLEKDAQRAVDLYTAVARGYPQDTLADDSLYLAAELEGNVLNEYARAATLYRQIISIYPKGDMAPKARRKIGTPEQEPPAQPVSYRQVRLEELNLPAAGRDEFASPRNIAEMKGPGDLHPIVGSTEKLLGRTSGTSISGIKIPGAGLHCIVVDAGHGGKDPGAIGPGGIQEKNVALAMARILVQRLRAELGCRVLLSRDRDVYLSTKERVALANKAEADLFISIHANSALDGRAYGIETYSLNYSKNNQAVTVVARENNTSLKEVGDLEHILFDLMANAKLFESSRLAAEIQRNLIDMLDDHYSKVKNLGVRQGPFHVLLGATMPSVLIEVGFISNAREEKRLNDVRYQEHAMNGVAAGVSRYVKERMLMAEK